MRPFESTMMGLALLLAVLFSFLLRGLMFAIRRGQFVVLAEDQRRFAFRTDFGQFQIRNDPPRLLAAPKDGLELSIPLDQIQGLKYGYEAKWARTEEWIAGFDLWDFSDRYGDRLHWYRITARFADGRTLPLFAAGQYEPREPLLRWWYEFQVRVLAELGFYRSVEPLALGILERLRARFAAAGRPLPLI